MRQFRFATMFTVIILGVLAPTAAGQTATQRAPVTSPQVTAERKITFRITAPNARAIRLSASDIPGFEQSPLTKADDGLWEVTVGPIEPGAYRYRFNVDGVTTVDPRNPSISESNNNVWSMVYVPGSDLLDVRDVPHGSIAKVIYKSTALGGFRRMHIYTPPGYDTNRDRYPVLYLLHGGTESDETWSSVGRAGFSLDNLIAAGRAKPMIVVMPAGHAFPNSVTGPLAGRKGSEEFAADFTRDLMPYVEHHYRVLTDRVNTAVAGLSIGGHHALEVAIPRLERFGYIGVFSSGLFGAFRDPQRSPQSAHPFLLASEWEQLHAAKLDSVDLKKACGFCGSPPAGRTAPCGKLKQPWTY